MAAAQEYSRQDAVLLPRREIDALIQQDADHNPQPPLANDQQPAAPVGVSAPERQREVILRTPVIYGTSFFPGVTSSVVTKYLKGEHLTSRPPPAPIPPGAHTMAIRMPQEGVADYVRDHLAWLPLRSDEQLVEGLEDLLLEREASKVVKPSRSLRIAELVDGPLFQSLSESVQHRVLDKLEELQHGRRYQGAAQEADLRHWSLLESLFPDKGPMGGESKAKLKYQDKRRQIAVLQFEKGEKPKDIAKKLRVAVSLVYRTAELTRKRLRQLVERSLDEDGYLAQAPTGHHLRRKRRDDPVVHLAIKDYLQRFGIHDLTARKVQAHIRQFQPDLKPLRALDVSYLLKNVYHLSFKKLDPAAFRYRDPFYDEKRIWASRLLAQFQLDGALIISIDESGFRRDAPVGRRWQFHPKVRDVFFHLGRSGVPKDEEAFASKEAKQSEPPVWGEIAEELSQRSQSERNFTRRR